MDYKLPKLPDRIEDSNKGTFGKVLNISGSEYMPGAAYLSSIATLKVGAGYVVLAAEKEVLETVSKLAPEIVLSKKSSRTVYELSENADAIIYGCGLSECWETVTYLELVLEAKINASLVIDADGLNVLAKKKNLEKLVQKSRNIILTPHPKEASRLLNCTLEEILYDREKAAKDISKKYNCVTVLKSHKTIVTDGEIVYTNNTGNSALAKAGSGDVLAGIIAGLLAQKMSLFDAAVLGVYLHGLAGDLAKNDLTAYGVLASDAIRYIPNAISNFIQRN